jgi:hypothetical protein
VGNKPEYMPLDCHLFFDVRDSNDRNITLTSSKPMGPKEDPCKFGRYGAGTPKHLGDSLRLTWAQHPSSERIVEDICRLPAAIDATIAHKGCHVPEEAFHKKGCSRKKRKARSGLGLSSAVSEIARQRYGGLRLQAQSMSVES